VLGRGRRPARLSVPHVAMAIRSPVDASGRCPVGGRPTRWGPGMLFIVANGITGGVRAGVAAAFGAAAGMVVHTVAAALGLAALFLHAPLAYDLVRIAGAGYLLWLAAKAFRATGPAVPARLGTPERRRGRRACSSARWQQPGQPQGHLVLRQLPAAV